MRNAFLCVILAFVGVFGVWGYANAAVLYQYNSPPYFVVGATGYPYYFDKLYVWHANTSTATGNTYIGFYLSTHNNGYFYGIENPAGRGLYEWNDAELTDLNGFWAFSGFATSSAGEWNGDYISYPTTSSSVIFRVGTNLTNGKYYTLKLPVTGGYDTHFLGDGRLEALESGTPTFPPAADIVVADTQADAFWIAGGPPPSSISIIQPENATTTTNTAYLNFWGVGVTLNDTSTLNNGLTALIQVKYCSLDTGCPAYLIDNYISHWYSTGTGNIYFLKNYELDNALWLAQAFLYSGESTTSTLLASSATSTFTIASGITIATTTQFFVGACNYTTSSFLADPIGNLQQGICNAFAYLFVPTPPQQAVLASRLDTLKDTVGSKAPIGYFSLVRTAFNSLIVGATSTGDLAIGAFSDFFDLLRTGLICIFWAMFAFWLLKRITLIEL